jgi:hypothetical protein
MSVETYELRAGLPGWLIRLAIAVAAGAICVVLAVSGVAGVALGLLGLAALMSVAMPSSPAPMLLLVVTALSVAVVGAGPFSWPVLTMIPLVHLFHLTCSLAGLLPARSRVHLAALRRPARRFLGIQAVTFALAGLTALIPAGRSLPAFEFAAIIGVAALALLLAWLLDRPH